MAKNLDGGERCHALPGQTLTPKGGSERYLVLHRNLGGAYILGMLWRSSRNGRAGSPRAPLAFIDPCLPTRAGWPPEGDDWLHEIKHDGIRLQVHVTPGRVRLLTMTGVDWTERYPR